MQRVLIELSLFYELFSPVMSSHHPRCLLLTFHGYSSVFTHTFGSNIVYIEFFLVAERKHCEFMILSCRFLCLLSIMALTNLFFSFFYH